MDAGTISILLQARDEMSGVLDSAAGSAGGFGSKMGLVSAAAGVALVGLGAAAVKGLAVVGESFDEAYDTIRVGTGATGEALGDLQDQFKDVVSNVPTDFATASTAVADLNTRLGLTGDPLEQMATQFINLGRIAGEDTPTLIAAGTRAFGDWAIATEDQSGALDHMFRVSQSTGIGVSSLMEQVVKFGAPMRQMGFSFEESTALMGSWEKEGVNTELVLGSMRIAMGKFADAGIPMREGLDQTIAAIQELGPGAEATSLAMDVFGARAGPDMAAAILEGRFAIDDLMTTLSGSGDTINGVAAATDDWREKLQILKNKGMVALEPVANFVFGSINTAVDLLILTIGYLSGALGGPLRAAFGFLKGAVAGVLDGWKQLSSEDNASWFEAIGFRARQVAGFFTGTLVPAIQSFANLWTRTVLPVLRFVADIFARQARSFLTFASAVGVAIDALRNGDFAGALSGIATAFLEHLSRLGGIAADVGKTILDAILGVDWGGIASKGVNALVAGWEAVADLGSRLLSWASDQITGVDWVGIASDVGGDIVDGVLAAVRAVADFGSRIASWASDQITGVDWAATASDAGTAIVDGVLDAVATVVDFGSRFATWVGEQVGAVDWAGEASDVGTAITDGAMAAIEAVADWGTRFATWVSGQLAAVEWSAVGTAIIDGITTGLTSAQGFGQSLVDALSPSLQSADWAGPASGIVSGITGAMAGMDWSGMVSGLTSGVTSAVTALAPLWESLSTAASTILPSLTNLWNGLSESFSGSSGIMSSLSTLWATLVTSAQELWAALVPLQPVFIAIGAVIGGIIVVAIGLLMGILGGLVGLLSGALPGAIQMVSGLITAMAGAIQVAVSIITGVLNIVVALLKGDWAGAWQAAKTMVQGVADGIRTIISGMATAVTGAITGMVNGVKGLITGFVNAIIGFFENLYHEIVGGSIIPDMVNGIVEWIGKLPGLVAGILSGFVSSALGFFQNLWTESVGKISGMAGEVVGKISEFVGQVPSILSGFVSSTLGFFQDLWTESVGKVVGLKDEAIEKLGELVTSGAEKAGELKRQALEKITEFASEALTSLTTFVGDAVKEIGSLPGKAVEALGDLSGTLLSAGGDLVGGLIKGIRDKIPSLDDAVGALGDALGKLDVPFFSPPDHAGLEMGHMFAGSIAVGIRDRVVDVSNAVSTIGQSLAATGGAVETAHASGAQLADAIIAGYESQADGFEGHLAALPLAAMAELQSRADELSVSLMLANIAGDDTAELQAQLDAITEIMASWADENNTSIVAALGADSAGAAIHDSWMGLLSDLDGIISGDVQGALTKQLFALQEQLAVATAGNAPQTVIDALNASMASVEGQLAQVGAVYQQAIQQGMVDAYTPEMVAGFADKLDGIIQGTLVPDLQASLDEANARVAAATALGWNQELVDAYQAQADELAESLAQANSDTAAAAAAGLLSPDAQAAYNDAMGVITEIPLDQIRALIPLMENGGTELIDSLVGAIADGRLAADDAWSMLSDMSGEQIDIMRDQLETLEEQLTVQLAQAWLDGTDPTGIAANLAAIQDLLSQTADVATDTADTVDDALRSLNAPSGDGGGGGGGGGGLAYGGRGADPSGTAGGGSAPTGDSGPLPGVGAGPDLSSDDRSAVQEIGEIIGKEVAAAVRESLAGVL